MTFQAGEGARRVLRLWIALAGVLASGLTGLLAGLLTPWLLLLTALVSVLTVFLFLWYPQRYAASLKGGFDGEAVRAQMGVLWRRQIFVPMQALRTFDSDPAFRRRSGDPSPSSRSGRPHAHPDAGGMRGRRCVRRPFLEIATARGGRWSGH